MDKDKIMEAMGYIDPGLVEEAGREAAAVKRGRRGWSRPAVIAACLCAVLAGTAVAAELAGVRILDFWENETRVVDPDGAREEVSGVTISRGIRYFSIDEFSRQIVEMDRGFTEPAARSFSSWEEMEDFVGIRVMENPVLAAVRSGGAVDVGLPDGEGRFVARFDPGPGHASDGVTPMEGIVGITLYGGYYLHRGDPDLRPWNGICVDVSAELALDTENRPLDEMEMFYSPDEAAVTRETYVTSNGLSALISKAEIPEREGGSAPSPAVDWYTAYFTLDGVFFRVSTVDYKGFNGGNIPAGLVEETLKEVLDGFACTTGG